MIFKYKWATVINGKVHKASDVDKEVVISKASEILRKNNIKFDREKLVAQIDRQSKAGAQEKPYIDLQGAYRGALAILNYTAGNAVSEAESLRRASICASCPLSSNIQGCSACGLAGKITKFVNGIKKMTGNFAIPNYSSNKFCGFCGCSIPLMIVTKLSNFKQEPNSQNIHRPDVCWLKKTSINFTNE